MLSIEKKIPVYKIAFDHWKKSIKVFCIFCYIWCVLDNLITYTVFWILYAQWAKTWENSTQGKKYKNSLQLWGNYSTSSIIFPKLHLYFRILAYCTVVLHFTWISDEVCESLDKIRKACQASSKIYRMIRKTDLVSCLYRLVDLFWRKRFDDSDTLNHTKKMRLVEDPEIN